ncbi:MAG: Zn-dependent hydrolase [Thermoleophilia bacterium]|nr:Zn-dependent hydrolase [Thermoleophilia bacterium]
MLTLAPEGRTRLVRRLDELYAIGGGTGANRLAWTREEQEAHDLVRRWMEEAGLAVEVDRAGNLVGRRLAASPRGPEIWTGSHLDSVPRGGRFDGALGVLAGLEAVELAAGGKEPPRTLAVVAFRDEEGARFGRGFLGSRALVGLVEGAELDVRDAAGTSVREAVAGAGFSLLPFPNDPAARPGAFVECHIEQGPVLAEASAPVGVVTGIVGVARGEVEIRGRAGHAGTTPMRARADALCAAAEYILRVRDAACAVPDAVATVGRIDVEPGAVNVIPALARMSVDARAPDPAAFERLLAAIPEASTRLLEPVSLSPEVASALRAAIAARGVRLVELRSGAGHDAGVLATVGIPSAMLFVRSLAGGASHSPEEDSSIEDCVLAVEVLADALARLAAAPSAGSPPSTASGREAVGE